MGLKNLPNHTATGGLTGIHHAIREAPVNRLADSEEVQQPLTGVVSLEQGPIGILVRAFQLLVNRAMQIHHKAPIAQAGTVFREQDGATAGGKNYGVLISQFRDHVCFPFAKT
jgi:hypothetical protein